MSEPNAFTPQNPNAQAILEALNRCINACENCISGCLSEEHAQMMVRCIAYSRDCADYCRLTAAFIARRSEHAPHVIRECIEICQKCYLECSQHQDDHCKECAAACQACVEACRTY
ncbi:four-helix bundle copper-binding protein [Hymenobacter cavernae]|uniref:Four-helix bundle copper-binding protein n=1 Tax=Hymenobacter cavernae TaxID=2044852 RepID=A0ABQ1UP41_9BACT|nr:four-helix bundle copper-binding protein [Hymenobacter cavernae]GGF21689.1 hypothetical protein GCM10011383_36660 [Hymenobacter cavernae]